MADTKLSALAGGTTSDFFYGEEGLVSKKYAGLKIVNVIDYGADPTGGADSTVKIQNAINAVGSGGGGGGVVWFPPGTYTITASLVSYNSGVRLVGSGKKATTLAGNFAGFIIDQNINHGVPDQPGPYVGTTGGFASVGYMTIKNTLVSPGASCTLGTISGATTFTVGGTVTGTFQLGMTVYNTSTGVVYGMLSSGGPITWTLDYDHGGGNVTNVSITAQGYDQTLGAVRWNSDDAGYIHNCILTGWTGFSGQRGAFNTILENVTFTSTSQGCGTVAGFCGNVTLISCTAHGWWLGFAFRDADAAMVGCRTETNNTGIILGMNAWGQSDQITGISIMGLSTEACNYGIISSGGAFNASISGAAITGTVGTTYPIFSISGNGSIVTVVITSSGGLTSLDLLGWGNVLTRQVKIEDPGGAFATGFVTATRVNKTTFTYSSSVISGVGPSPVWCFKQQFGASFHKGDTIAVDGMGVNISDLEGVGIDLYNGGFNDAGRRTFTSCNAGGSWGMPGSAKKNSVTYINCDQPTGNTLDVYGNAAGMNFADLPGQPGVIASPVENMTYDICDCNYTGFPTPTFGVTAGGGASTSNAGAHRRVRYNALLPGWQVVG